MVEIELDLLHHCIETEVKRVYDLTLSQYFRISGENSVLERQLAMLQRCMETFDFSALRGLYAELAGGYESAVVLREHDQGVWEIVFADSVVRPPLLHG